MKKNVPLLICVQSKNNLPSLSTAHWGRLVKESVSAESESKCCRGPNKKRRERGRERREGLRWKMEHKWEGRDRVRATHTRKKKRQRRKRAGKDVGQMNLRESENEFMMLQRPLSGSDSRVVNCSPSPRQSASQAQAMPLHTYLAPRLL